MLVEIKFAHGESNLFAQTQNDSMDLAIQDQVILRSDRGLHYGKVIRKAGENPNIKPEATVLRKVNAEDQSRIDWLEGESFQVKSRVRELVAQQNLDMKIIDCAYNLEKTQLFISFTAEKRVDFRTLLKELAVNFHARIELRQIGARDAAKVYGGVGPCGRPLCCSEFIYEFPNVSIKMAKNQSLSLKQSKLNGMCGRLMCCLTYEDDFYREAQKRFPDFGDWIPMPEGRGRVIGLNILEEKVKLRFDESVREYDLTEIEELHV